MSIDGGPWVTRIHAGDAVPLPEDSCRHLWAAVIAQLFEDACGKRPIGANGTDADRVRRTARIWFLKPNSGFDLCCNLASLDPEKVRAIARKAIAAADDGKAWERPTFESVFGSVSQNEAADDNEPDF